MSHWTHISICYSHINLVKAALVERLKAALDNSVAVTGANGSGSRGPGSAASAPRQQTLMHPINKTLIHNEILLEAQIGRQAKLPLSAKMKSCFAATKKVSLQPARPVRAAEGSKKPHFGAVFLFWSVIAECQGGDEHRDSCQLFFEDDFDAKRVLAEKEGREQAKACICIERQLATPVASGSHAVSGRCGATCPLPKIKISANEDGVADKTIMLPLTDVAQFAAACKASTVARGDDTVVNKEIRSLCSALAAGQPIKTYIRSIRDISTHTHRGLAFSSSARSSPSRTSWSLPATPCSRCSRKLNRVLAATMELI